MKAEIKHGPAFATLFADLEPGGESLVAEAGAMASMSASVRMTTRFNGGFWGALLKRVLGAESLFVNAFSIPAGAEKGHVVLGQATPGDMKEIHLQNEVLYIQAGSYLASGQGVRLRLGWAGWRSFFGGEGLFRLKVSGTGPVWLAAYGGIYERDVDQNHIVDTGHLLAYSPTCKIRLKLPGGLFSILFGGEGLVMNIEGPGKIYLQSRSMDGLASWTNAHL